MDKMPGGEQITRWPFPSANKLQNFSLWQMGSAIVIPAVGILSKIMADWLSTVTVHNREILIDAIDNRPKGTPLITVCNHHSCLDDPFLWGILDWKHVLNCHIMRWTAAAHDICFTNDWHAKFFAFGKTFPVIRGAGVYQKGMDFCLERLNAGAWVHIFPEGKVNMAKNEFIRLKWGIGRLIAECKICPIVIPFWHLGMDSVLPNVEPYRPKICQTVTVLIGKRLDFSALREKIWEEIKLHVDSLTTHEIIRDSHVESLEQNDKSTQTKLFEKMNETLIHPLKPEDEINHNTFLSDRMNSSGEMQCILKAEERQRKILTDIIQDELRQLKSEAECLHYGSS